MRRPIGPSGLGLVLSGDSPVAVADVEPGAGFIDEYSSSHCIAVLKSYLLQLKYYLYIVFVERHHHIEIIQLVMLIKIVY